MRLLTTGSRDWEGPRAEAGIQQVLNAVLSLSETLNSPLTVVHGACPTGADQCVDRWARRRDDTVALETHPADWRKLGKRAGPIRNQDMVDRGADLCIGFLKDGSTGTRNCLALAKNAKIPTFIVDWDPSFNPPPLALVRRLGTSEETRDVA